MEEASLGTVDACTSPANNRTLLTRESGSLHRVLGKNPYFILTVLAFSLLRSTNGYRRTVIEQPGKVLSDKPVMT